MKCKPYSENTVEIGTQLKTVKITSNIFAVYGGQKLEFYYRICNLDSPFDDARGQ